MAYVVYSCVSVYLCPICIFSGIFLESFVENCSIHLPYANLFGHLKSNSVFQFRDHSSAGLWCDRSLYYHHSSAGLLVCGVIALSTVITLPLAC